ncbi:MAG: hypothetical protein KAT17_07770 [Candidatus Aminicenantes bacterium]|nr:hypothetical protein [Candidatus Aminicenantes bacterium]
MKIMVVIGIAVLLAAFPGRADGKNSLNHYDIKLKLDPEHQVMSVQANVTLHSIESHTDSLTFYLHKQFRLKKVLGKGIQHFSFKKDISCPIAWIPEGRALVITLERKGDRTGPFNISLEYEGKITDWPVWSANVLTGEWVELGLYLPWFPCNPDYGLFTFEIEAECSADYRLRSYGHYKFSNGKWFFTWTVPTNDIVLVAGKRLKTIKMKSGGNQILVHYSTLREQTVEKLSGDLIKILNLFDQWFGGEKKGEIALIESLRKKGGGYARRGLISLAGLSDETYFRRHESYIRYLAHEASHVWWSMAPTDSWEDWLNEGFAEYSALLVVREMFGEQAFHNRLAKKKSDLKASQPIRGFDRNDRSTPEKSRMIEVNLYSKGPFLLHRLSERIKADQFRALCQKMISLSISSTADFLALLEKYHGRDLKNWFEGLLNSY